MADRIIEVTRRGRKGEDGDPGATALAAITTGGSSTVYTVTNASPQLSYSDGYGVTIKAHATNGATPTANIDTLGAKSIKKYSGGSVVAIAAGDMVINQFYVLHYSSDADALILFGADVWSMLKNVVEDTTPQLGGPLDTNSKQINESKGADVASAAALTLGADGNYFDITGTTGITSIVTRGIGTEVTLHFDAILTLTHHATDLILPNGQDITTYAGYVATFREYASGDWELISDNISSTSIAFTPTLTFGGNSVGMIYQQQKGSYTLVGNLVFVRVFIDLNTLGSSTGDARIEGFPFAAEAVLGINNPVTIRASNISFADFLMGYVQTGNSFVHLQEVTNAGAPSNLTEANFSSSSSIMLSVFYEI